MPFNNETNRKRVVKMIEMFDLIMVSARSNRTPTEDVDAMLAPLAERLAGISPLAPTPATEEGINGRRPTWSTVRQMAAQAPLKELTAAMAVYLDRIEDALHAHSMPNGGPK